jgi:hypothetical protein
MELHLRSLGRAPIHCGERHIHTKFHPVWCFVLTSHYNTAQHITVIQCLLHYPQKLTEHEPAYGVRVRERRISRRGGGIFRISSLHLFRYHLCLYTSFATPVALHLFRYTCFVTPRCQPCIGVALLRAGSLPRSCSRRSRLLSNA